MPVVVTLTMQDSIAPRIVDALCAEGGRQEDSTTPKAQFAKNVLVEWVRGVVFKYETQKAAETARVAADQKARAEIVIT